MTTVAPPVDLEGRQRIRLRLRPNLRITPQADGPRLAFVVKDPLTRRYFRLDERQRFLVGLMDGRHTLAALRAAYEERYRPDRLAAEELEGFAAELLHGGLVEIDAPAAGRLAVDRAARARRSWLPALLNPFCVELPLGRPDCVLAWCRPLGRGLFNPYATVLVLGLFVAALVLLAVHWQEFLARLPAARDFFRPRMLFYLWLTLGLVKVLHELGHGLCCQCMGAEVKRFGILVLFFFPTLYCDVSDSWALPGRWRRIAVAAAGVYVELIVAGLAAFVWWFSTPASVPHHLALAVLVVCGTTTVLCNANPLMRFDGYYILADLAGTPNLAQQARDCLRQACLRWLGAEVRRAAPVGPVGPGLLGAYAVASLLYRGYVAALALYLLAAFLAARQLPVLGGVLAAVGATTLLGVPAGQFLLSLHRQRGFTAMQPFRLTLAAAVLLGLAGGFVLVPLPMRVGGVGLVQVAPEHLQRVTAPDAAGFLDELRVRDGQRVKAGDVLAVLANPRLEVKLRVNEADQALRHRQQDALVTALAEPGAADGATGPAWQECDHELKALRQQHRTLQWQRERLVLRAPCDGVVMGLPGPEARGQWLEQGTELCRVGNDRALRVVVLVAPADHRLVREGAEASVRIHGTGASAYPGIVTAVAQVEAKAVPPALCASAAGDVPTQHDAVTNTDRPLGQHYLVTVHLKALDERVHPGVLGQVRIDAEPQSLGWRLRRYLGTALSGGL